LSAPVGRRGWLVAGSLAAAALLVLAVLGEDRQQTLQRHAASGPLREVEAARVSAVRIAQGDGHWRLVRRGASRHFAFDAAPSPASPETHARVEAALRLLRNAASERRFDRESPEFGLGGAQALRVAVEVDGDTPYEFVFGATNPIGLARYTRVAHVGRNDVLLLPSYVAEAWQRVVGLE
jgi:hypothetical protein